jgi:hypothetical protein
VIAGTAFAFCPYRAAQVSHLQVLMAGWMPIGLWALHRYFAQPQPAALAIFGGAFLAQGLSNGYYLFFFTLPVAVVAVDGLVRVRRAAVRVWGQWVVAGLLIAAVLAPVAAVYMEVRRERGHVRNRAEIERYSADLASYGHVAPAVRLWSRVLPIGAGERELFPGMTVTALGVLAVLTGWRRQGAGRSPSARRVTGLYSTIGVAALVLSLGPAPRAWGEPVVSAGPYEWLLAVVPGLDGLRVPARLAMVVCLALTVLAGLAVARYFRLMAPRLRAAVGTLIVCVVLAEGYAGPITIKFLPRLPAADQAAYAWLAARPPGAVLELPAHGAPTDALRYVYRTLEHRHPIVNGYSGYSTPLSYFLGGPRSPLPEVSQIGALIGGLRSIGIRYLVVHEDFYEDRHDARPILDAILEQRDQLHATYSSGWTTVVELKESSGPTAPDPTARRLIARHEFTARASPSAEPVAFAFDGDAESRWQSGGRQRGEEWIAIEFARRQPVAGLRVQVSPRSLGDYPRRLRIESSADGVHFDEVVHDDAFLPALLHGFRRPAWPVVVDIVWPPADAQAIRVRQVGQSSRSWSVDEISVWRP